MIHDCTNCTNCNKNAGTSQIYTTALRINYLSSGVHSDASPLVVTKLLLLQLAAFLLIKQRGAFWCIAIGRYKTASPPIGCGRHLGSRGADIVEGRCAPPLAHFEGGEKEEGQSAQQRGTATREEEHVAKIPLALGTALKIYQGMMRTSFTKCFTT